jgi:uncharacterized protein (UPF0297 family)
MAGAVSAGAYTAGVIDYMIETLERWQQKKSATQNKLDKGEPLTAEEALIPMHDVVVEVLSGASAGGMTAAVLAYSFNDGSYITKRAGKLIAGNYDLPAATDTPTKLYNSWINMVDDAQGSTFKKLMDTKDVVSIEAMKSLLNSQPIDDIAANAIPATINFTPPAYISPNVSVILSVTNLEGIPIDIRFSNIESDNPTRNVLKMHSGFLHYQFNAQVVGIDFPPEIVTNNSRDHLAVAAKATGAFPFGLSNRKIVVNHTFFDGFKTALKTNYNLNVNLELPAGKDYVFNAVDGGAINNEPIGTTVKVLDSKKKLYHPDEENYMILIDPFPSVTNAQQQFKYEEPKAYNLFQQAFKIFGAFRNQSAFKQEDLLSGLEMDDNRFLIYPAKRRYYFLASGLIGGFSGFLKKAFRSHDYQLGRKNCQAFLRYYFGERIDKFEQITGAVLSEEVKQHWCYDVNFGQPEKGQLLKMPLIPDMLQLDKANAKTEIAVPVYDGITTTEMSEVNNLITARIKAIIDSSYTFLSAKGKNINKILGWIMQLLPGFVKRKLLNAATQKIQQYLDETFYPQSVKQDMLITRFADVIEKDGALYQKIKGVYATVANGGERIISVTSDGKETAAVASKGDFIVTNDTSSQEKYIVPAEKFNDRYVHSKDNYYIPNDKARVFALQVTQDVIYQYHLQELERLIINPGQPVFIEAPWSESQTLRLNDYLVCPNKKNEVYRIAQLEFNETYIRV